MLDVWLIEIGKAIGKIFLHPLFYWVILLYALIGYRRIKAERKQFGVKINSLFAEGAGTVGIAMLFSILVSVVTILFGLVLSFEVVVLLAIVLFLWSLSFTPSFLSASYTITVTFLILLILSNVEIDFFAQYGYFTNVSSVQFISLSLLAGLFLIAEAMLLRSNKTGWRFPQLVRSNRGIWIGQHRLRKLSFIPFLTFVPINGESNLFPFMPYFEIGNESFGLLFIPFYLGFNYTVQTELPQLAARRLSTATFMLATIVVFLAIGGIYYFYLSIAAVIVAIIGKEWITYRHRMREQRKRALFTPLLEGVKVLGILPNSSAQRLGIGIGETIVKVNDKPVNNSTELYEALQNSGAFVKLDILDTNGEIRFIRSAYYEVDHYKLCILFTEKN